MSKILIVGAGPTGLTAAAELYRRGFAPRLIDRKDAPSPLSRAVGINARSLDLLETCGATPLLLERGLKIRRAAIHAGGRVLGHIHLDQLDHKYNFLLALPQDETERVLSERLAAYGGAVEYGTALTHIALEGGRASVTLDNAPPETYDLVIAADGAHSTVRQALGIPFEGYDYPARWSIADFECAGWDGKADLFLLDGGHVRFLVRIGAHRFRAVADEPEALESLPINAPVEAVHRAGSFTIAVRQARTYRQGCVYLAGDAAHVHSPAGGRGMNLGIEDACDLAARLTEGTLAGYSAARRPVGRATIRLSEALVRNATRDGLIARIVRRLLLALLDRFPALQKPLLRRVSGLA